MTECKRAEIADPPGFSTLLDIVNRGQASIRQQYAMAAMRGLALRLNPLDPKSEAADFAAAAFAAADAMLAFEAAEKAKAGEAQ